jgi:hypothetical protein
MKKKQILNIYSIEQPDFVQECPNYIDNQRLSLHTENEYLQSLHVYNLWFTTTVGVLTVIYIFTGVRSIPMLI